MISIFLNNIKISDNILGTYLLSISESIIFCIGIKLGEFVTNRENNPDGGTQERPTFLSRATLMNLSYGYFCSTFNHTPQNLYPRFRSVLFNTVFVALLEVVSNHTAICQTGNWRNIGLQDVPIINLIVNESPSYQSETHSSTEMIYALTPTNIYVWSGGERWHMFNDSRMDREMTCFPAVTKQAQELICVTQQGMVQSSPLGSEWKFFSEGFGPDHSVISLSVSRSNPKIMYVVLADDEPSPGDDELVKSDDGGETWFRVGTLPRTEYFISLHEVYVDPKHSNIVYVTMDEAGVPWVFKSVDEGATWHSIEHRHSVAEIANLVFDPVNPKIVNFIGGTVHQRGIYKTADGFQSYHLKMSVNHLCTLTMHPRNRRHLYATAFPHSVLQSTDAGDTWSSVDTEPLRECVVLSLGVNSQSTIYVGTEHNGVFVYESTKPKLSSLEKSSKAVLSVTKCKSN